MYLSLDTPIAINPMKSAYSPSQVCSIIAESINQVIVMTTPNERLTVKMREILDEAVKWCLEHNRPSLLRVRDRLKVLPGHGETKDGIIARLNFLLTNEKMMQILCGNDSIQWGKFITEKRSLVVDCFGMSKEEFVFTGSSITHGIKNYFRYERPKEYNPLRLIIDECHNFVSVNLLDILKEGRKYKLSCVLSTQDLNFDERLARAMLNAGTIIAFRLGAREAQLVAQEMCCKKEDLQMLEKYYVAYKTPSRQGIAKTPSPPIVKELAIKKVEPQPKSRWFVLESYQC